MTLLRQSFFSLLLIATASITAKAETLAHYIIGDSITVVNFVYFSGPLNYKTSSLGFWGGGATPTGNIKNEAEYPAEEQVVNFPSHPENPFPPYVPSGFYEDNGYWLNWTNQDIPGSPGNVIEPIFPFFTFKPNEGYQASITGISFDIGASVGTTAVTSPINFSYNIYYCNLPSGVNPETNPNDPNWQWNLLTGGTAATLTSSDAFTANDLGNVYVDLSNTDLGIIQGGVGFLITFSDNATGSDVDGYLLARNIILNGTVTQIPEPSTFLLMGGLLVLPFVRRRRS